MASLRLSLFVWSDCDSSKIKLNELNFEAFIFVLKTWISSALRIKNIFVPQCWLAWQFQRHENTSSGFQTPSNVWEFGEERSGRLWRDKIRGKNWKIFQFFKSVVLVNNKRILMINVFSILRVLLQYILNLKNISKPPKTFENLIQYNFVVFKIAGILYYEEN